MEEPKGRRIIAEESKWNLAAVEPLKKICLDRFIANFCTTPCLKGIPAKFRANIVSRIAIDIPVESVIGVVPDEEYWKRRSLAELTNCDVSAHGNSWLRLYCERTLSAKIAELVPAVGQESQLYVFLALFSPYVVKLNIPQLQPRTDYPERKATDPNPDRMNPELLVQYLENLRHVSLYYGLNNIGIDFEWHLFGMTVNDSVMLSKALQKSKWESLSLSKCGIDDSKVGNICQGLHGHLYLKRLDLSHNKITDSGAVQIAALLDSGVVLEELDLTNNRIKALGAAHISRVLLKSKKKNTQKLKKLSLRLNPLGNEGCYILAHAIIECKESLDKLDFCCTGMGITALQNFSKLIKADLVKKLNISCNKFAKNKVSEAQEVDEVPETIALDLKDSVAASKLIETIDLRATDISSKIVREISCLLK